MKKPNPEPSIKQLEALRAIVRHVEKHGYQPSNNELGKLLGITRSAARDRLVGLAERGLIRFSKGEQERAIKIVNVTFKAVWMVETERGERPAK